MRIPKKKSPVYVPPKNAPNVILQYRDRLIFRFIASYDRCLTDYQILFLLHREADQLRIAGEVELAQEIETTSEALDVRLGKLAQAGYIHKLERWKREAFDYGIYWLTKQGAREHAGDEWKDHVFPNNPDFRQTEHDMAIVDFRLHVEQNVNKHDWLELVEWTNQSIFKEDPDRVPFVKRNGKPDSRNMIPDGFCLIRDHRLEKRKRNGESREVRVFLELDMGTKDRNKMMDEKVIPGIAYIHSDVYKQRFGGAHGWWLYVCADEDTMMLLKRKTDLYVNQKLKTDHKDYRNMFWFTHADYITDDVLTAPIWYRSGRDNKQFSLLNAAAGDY